MQHPTQKFGQGSIVFEKPGILPKKWAPTTIEFVEILHALPTYQCVQKGIRGSLVFFISFCLDLELFAKIKGPGFYTLTGTRFINNSGSKQNKKILTTHL